MTARYDWRAIFGATVDEAVSTIAAAIVERVHAAARDDMTPVPAAVIDTQTAAVADLLRVTLYPLVLRVIRSTEDRQGFLDRAAWASVTGQRAGEIGEAMVSSTMVSSTMVSSTMVAQIAWEDARALWTARPVPVGQEEPHG